MDANNSGDTILNSPSWGHPLRSPLSRKTLIVVLLVYGRVANILRLFRRVSQAVPMDLSYERSEAISTLMRGRDES
jgi:hypothetical protein